MRPLTLAAFLVLTTSVPAQETPPPTVVTVELTEPAPSPAERQDAELMKAWPKKRLDRAERCVIGEDVYTSWQLFGAIREHLPDPVDEQKRRDNGEVIPPKHLRIVAHADQAYDSVNSLLWVASSNGFDKLILQAGEAGEPIEIPMLPRDMWFAPPPPRDEGRKKVVVEQAAREEGDARRMMMRPTECFLGDVSIGGTTFSDKVAALRERLEKDRGDRKTINLALEIGYGVPVRNVVTFVRGFEEPAFHIRFERGDMMGGVFTFGGTPEQHERRQIARKRGARRRAIFGKLSPELERAFRWLGNQQYDDGAWRCDDDSDTLNDIGLTGLTVLAYAGIGQTSTQGPYRAKVRKGLAWLESEQDVKSGAFGVEEFGRLYGHAIATHACCTVWQQSTQSIAWGERPDEVTQRSRGLERVAKAAAQWLAGRQQKDGRWAFEAPPEPEEDEDVEDDPEETSPTAIDRDLLLTAWALVALDAARGVGFMVDPTVFGRGEAWLAARLESATSLEPVELAALWAGRLAAGGGEAPDLQKAAEIADTPPVWRPDHPTHDPEYWFFATHVVAQLGGDLWAPWDHALTREVVARQTAKGDDDEIGSWPGLDEGRSTVALYPTALACLAAEIAVMTRTERSDGK